MIALLLVGCGHPQEIIVPETMGYDWVNLNHRLSFFRADVAPAPDGGADVFLAAIGGTSTTGIVSPLPDGCSASSCQEFPVTDSANVHLGFGRLRGKLAIGSAEITLDADADGDEQTLTIPVDGAKGTGAAVITGFRLDTDHALGDGSSACYDPVNGWHPRILSVTVGNPTLGDDSATVPVSAHFAAGNSLEDVRQCIDDVHALATVGITLRVAVIAADGLGVTPQALDQSATFALGDGGRFDPDPQPPPDAAARPLDGDPAESIFGWCAFAWQFHVGDPDERGAYLRSLMLTADPDSGLASGHATNFSPGTQLTGFDYTFTGTVQAITLGGATVSHGHIDEDALPAALDVDGEPVITRETIPPPE